MKYEGREGQMTGKTPPQEKLPSKSPAFLGLTKKYFIQNAVF